MVFSSIIFLFLFLPFFFLAYFIAPARFKNIVILLGSICFYAWGAPRFIFVILGTTLADFFLVRLMDRSGSRHHRRLLLILSVSINLGLLVYFKYANFFIDNLNSFLQLGGTNYISWTRVALPIGISFYTFESLTYVVDVYRRVHKPLRNFWDYQLYIILFPKMIAGPIIRFHDFADQIHAHVQQESDENRLKGLYRFFIGLGKKVLIANVMGAAAEHIFGLPVGELSSGTAWLGAISYTFQIYFDFSGYSDMAIGLAVMMGFRFPENFNNPYTALSITDFWRRWHITLGAWMREYLYIPLGGNRVQKKSRLYLNLWLVFLASGLWHGAAWGFILWGAYHGLFLILERVFLGRWLQRMGPFAVCYTFPVVLVGWVFFRTEHISKGAAFVRQLFSAREGLHAWQPDREYILTLALAVFFSFFTLVPGGRRLQQRIFHDTYRLSLHYAMAAASVIICIVSAARITSSSFNPFIYFRF